jgi:hypothetical protein
VSAWVSTRAAKLGMADSRNIEINKAIGATASVGAVIAITQREADGLNLVNCVTALGRIAKLAQADKQPSEASLGHLAGLAAQRFRTEQCQTRHVAQALWACAKIRPAGLADLLCAVLDSAAHLQPAWFKPQEVSMIVWAVGKLWSAHADDNASSFVAKLLPSALARPWQFNSQGLSNIISGVASVGMPADTAAAVADKLTKSICGRLHEFCPQEVANSLHGLAKLGARFDACDGIACEVRKVVGANVAEYTPQQLANAAWACTKLLELAKREQDREALNFWTLFAPAARARVHEFNAQELSMLVWASAQALAQVRIAIGMAASPPALPLWLRAKARTHKPEPRDAKQDFHCQWLTGCVVQVSSADPALQDQVCSLASSFACAARTLAEDGALEAQQLATLALALAKLGLRAADRTALTALARAARARMGELNAQDLDNLSAALSRHELHFRSPKMVAALSAAGSALLQRRRMPPRNAANLLMAVAKLVATCRDGKQVT